MPVTEHDCVFHSWDIFGLGSPFYIWYLWISFTSVCQPVGRSHSVWCSSFICNLFVTKQSESVRSAAEATIRLYTKFKKILRSTPALDDSNILWVSLDMIILTGTLSPDEDPSLGCDLRLRNYFSNLDMNSVTQTWPYWLGNDLSKHLRQELRMDQGHDLGRWHNLDDS